MADFSKTPHFSGNNEPQDPMFAPPSTSREGQILSNPFDNLEEAVNSDQLQTWHQMNKRVRGLIQMSDDDDEEDDEMMESDNENMMDIFIDDTLMMQPETMETDKMEENTKKSPTVSHTVIKKMSDTNKDPTIDPSAILSKMPNNMELTLQYLSGKITFLEFSEMMEQEEEGVQDPAKSSSTQTQNDKDWAPQDDLTEKESVPKQKKPRMRKRRKCDIPKLLENDMGEVFMTFAQGNHELAIQQCLEIIRQAPNASKPFHTLGSIYEDLGDMQKCLQYWLIAAYLDGSNSEEWLKLAELCVEHNDIQQAIKCYTRAAATSKDKIHCLWERTKLYESLKDYKKAMEGYQAVLSLLPPDDSEKYFKLAWSITRSYFEMGQKQKAIDTISKAFRDHPDQISSEDVNLLLELLIPEKCYLKCIEVLVKHCGITFTYTDGEVWSTSQIKDIETLKDRAPVRCEIPDILPIDLRIKLAVCMIHLKYHKFIKKVLEPLFEENIEETGDLYLDIAEAYMENGYYKQAQPLLKQLVKTKNYHLAAVWLRYGECLKYLGDIQGAVKAYTCVVTLAPSHIGARMSLSALQQQLGKHEEALELLEQDYLSANPSWKLMDYYSASVSENMMKYREEFEEHRLSKDEQQMLLQKCYLLHAQGKITEFYNNAKQLLFQEWREMEAENMEYVKAIRTYKHRKDTVLAYFESKGKDFMKLSNHFKLDRKKTHLIAYEDLWDMFKLLCQALLDKKMIQELEDICLLGMLCPVFHKSESTVEEFEFFILNAALLTKNSLKAYSFVRDLVIKNLDHPAAWNLFIQVIMMCNDSRHNRFCLRRMIHEPSNIALGILNGHNSMASGSYKHSLGEYAHIFRRTPMDPLLSLCMGLDFIHSASQRFAAKRHYLVTQGIAFLNNYSELRGECQETYYNLGRALHQINILYAAAHYYKKVLSLPPCIQGDEMVDLRMEAAYNLSLIYESSGSHDYARYLLYKYCVI